MLLLLLLSLRQQYKVECFKWLEVSSMQCYVNVFRWFNENLACTKWIALPQATNIDRLAGLDNAVNVKLLSGSGAILIYDKPQKVCLQGRHRKHNNSR